jgi:hypothetical protein
MPGIGILGEPGVDLLAAALAAPLACWRGWASPRVAMSVAGAALITSLVLLACASPAFDDYSFANAGQSGWATFQVEMYRTWSGRFLANGVLSGWPLLLPFDAGYPIVVLAIWSGAVAAMAWLAWVVLPGNWSTASRSAVIAWLGFGWLAGLPHFADGVAWAAGSINYMLPTGLLAAGCAVLVGSTSGWRIAVAVPCLALACGGCEHVLVMAVLLTGGGCIWHWMRRRPGRKAWTIALLVVLISSAVSVAAPGHAHRRDATFATGHERPSMAGAIVMGAAGSTVQVGRAVGHAATVAALLLAAALAATASRRSGTGGRACWPLAAFAAAPMVHLAIELPILYGQGFGAPGRGQDLIWTGVWACLGAASIAGGMWWGGSGRGVQRIRLGMSTLTRSRSRIALAALAVLLAIAGLGLSDHIAVATAAGAVLLLVCVWLASLGLSGSSHRRRMESARVSFRALVVMCVVGAVFWGCWSDMLADLPRLPAHLRALSARHAALAAAGPGDLVRLPMWDPERTPRSIVDYDMTAGRSDNASQATWYGVGGIIVGPFRQPVVEPLPP